MSTQGNNLSAYEKENYKGVASFRIGIVASLWNNDITDNLLEGAKNALLDNGVVSKNITTVRTPGSFELPLAAQILFQQKELDAVICLGSVIKGETDHFHYVCNAVSLGIKDVSLKFGKPVVFGVLTDNTKQQAIDRSGGKHGNKGVEAAITALKMIALQNKLAN